MPLIGRLPREALVVALVLAARPASAQTQLVKHALSGAAVDVAGTAYRLRATLGESGFVGRTGNPAFTLGVGFWPGQYVIAHVVDAPETGWPAGDAGLVWANGLRQNSPNPFAGSTTISWVVGRRAPVRLDVFDIAGRRVTTLADRELDAGVHGVTWDGRDHAGARVGPGIYFYRLQVAGWSSTKRLSKLD